MSKMGRKGGKKEEKMRAGGGKASWGGVVVGWTKEGRKQCGKTKAKKREQRGKNGQTGKE